MRQADETLSLPGDEPNKIRNSLHMMAAHLHRYRTEMDTLVSIESSLHGVDSGLDDQLTITTEFNFGALQKFIGEIERKTQTILALVRVEEPLLMPCAYLR